MTMVPNFIILGVPKAATTSLAYYLSQHPRVFIPRIKEINYFGDDRYYDQGMAWYRKFFDGADAAKQSLIGEATPTYLYEGEKVAPRVHATLGDKVKFICLLRDPVTRAWSHYLHNIRHNTENRSFRDAINQEIEELQNNIAPDVQNAYYSFGDYADQIDKWYASYGKEKFFFVLYENFIGNPIPVTHDIFNFLGLDDTDIDIDVAAKNVGGAPRSKFLMNLLVSPPQSIKSFVKALLPMKIRRPILRKLIDLNSLRFTSRPRLSAEDQQFLHAKYRASFEKLEQLTGLDTSSWLEKN